MKKSALFSKSVLVLFLTLVLTMSLFPIFPKAAASKPMAEKELKAGVTYEYDLNGNGKKDAIRYTVKQASIPSIDSDYGCRLTLFINGKKSYSKTVDSALNARLSICDLNSKDGYLDLILYFTSDSACLDYMGFLRYSGSKITTIKSIISNKTNQFGQALIYRVSGISNIKSDGNFSIVADTPCSLNGIGSYLCRVPFQSKGNKITAVSSNTYSITSHSRKYNYKAAKTIPAYKKANSSSKKAFSIKKGGTVNLLKVKVSNSDKDNWAYIKTKAGKTGWIHLPESYDYDNPLFQQTPAWG